MAYWGRRLIGRRRSLVGASRPSAEVSKTWRLPEPAGGAEAPPGCGDVFWPLRGQKAECRRPRLRRQVPSAPGCLGHFWALRPKRPSPQAGSVAMGHASWLPACGDHFWAQKGPKVVERGWSGFWSHFGAKMGSQSGVQILGSIWGQKGDRRSLVKMTRLRRRPFWAPKSPPKSGVLGDFGGVSPTPETVYVFGNGQNRVIFQKRTQSLGWPSAMGRDPWF